MRLLRSISLVAILAAFPVACRDLYKSEMSKGSEPGEGGRRPGLPDMGGPDGSGPGGSGDGAEDGGPRDASAADGGSIAPLRKPQHVILFIGDGMQLAHEIAASRYLYGTDDGLSFHRFSYAGQAATWDVTAYNVSADRLGKPRYSPTGFDPAVGYDVARGGDKPYPLAAAASQDSYFLSAPATESASAMTAMMTGVKTDAGNISWLPGDPENGAIETIAEKLRRQLGYAVGIGSTVPFNHATPACVLAHNVSRFNLSADNKSFGYAGQTIAEEMAEEARPEVVVSAGHPDWLAGYVPRALYEALKGSPDYVFVERAAGGDGAGALLQGADRAVAESKKLWALFGGENGSLAPLVPAGAPGFPSLTRAKAEDPTLAEAVEAALKRLAADPDGFIAVFEEGDIDWGGHNNDFGWIVGAVAGLSDAVAAAAAFVDRPGDAIDWDNTLLVVTADHATGYLRFNAAKPLRKGDLPAQVSDGGRFAYPDGEVSFGTGGHTNELVRIYARGSGADRFAEYEGRRYPGTRILDNTDLFRVIRGVAGVE